jgi:hypothetical protein
MKQALNEEAYKSHSSALALFRALQDAGFKETV